MNSIDDTRTRAHLRIGTWNLDARWSTKHARVLTEADCDVWLLTEVLDSVGLTGYAAHRCAARMSRGQHYAAVLSRIDMQPKPDPHPASASVAIEGTTYCCSILPWAGKDNPLVWGDGTRGERTRAAVRLLAATLPPGETVWGGDLNHALQGPLKWSGSALGRDEINRLVDILKIDMPTATLPHRRAGQLSIDQVGTPRDWTILDASRIQVHETLSDHDAYIVTAAPPSLITQQTK